MTRTRITRTALTLLAFTLLPAIASAQLSTRTQREIESCVAQGLSLCGGGGATTEAGLESDLTDVTNVFTNNDTIPAVNQALQDRITGGGSTLTASASGATLDNGQLLLPDGTAAAPALAFTNEPGTDMGFYRISTNNMGWAGTGVLDIQFSPQTINLIQATACFNISGHNIICENKIVQDATATTDTAPNDDTTDKRIELQKLAAPPTNAAYIAFTNNPGTDVFYLVLTEQ